MADVRFGIDAREARTGADEWIRQAQRIRQEARSVVAEVRAVREAFASVSAGGPASAAAVPAAVTAARQAARAYGEAAQAARRQREIERALEADRLRAMREQTRADVERLREREAAERRLRSLESRLGDKFPEERAISQRIIAERDLQRAVANGLVDEQRALVLRQKIAENFSTQAVAARSLRANIATLASGMTDLASTSTGALAPLLNLASTVRRIAVAVGANAAIAGGSVNPSEGGGSGGAAGAIGVLGGSLGRLGALAGPAVAGIAAVAGGALLLAPAIARASIQMDQIEGRLRAATGSAAQAKEEFGFVRETADRLGLALADSAGGYARVAAAAKGTALEGQATRDVFLGIATASSALRLSAAETSGVLFAVEQIISKNRLSSEELRRQLGDRLPGAFTIAANSLGVTTQELDKMLQLGQITADEFLPKFAAEIKKRFGEESVQAAKSLQAQIKRLKNEILILLDAIGDTGVVDAFAKSIGGLASVLRSLSGTNFDPATAFEAADRKLTELEERAKARDRGAAVMIRGARDERNEALERLREQQRAAFDRESANRTNALRAQEDQRANQLVELRDKLDKVGKAQREFNATVSELNGLREKGALGEAEYQKLLALAKKDLDDSTGATKAAGAAAREHAQEIKREAEARQKAEESLAEYLRTLGTEAALASQTNEQRELATALIEAQTRAQRTLTEEEKRSIESRIRAKQEAEKAQQAAEDAKRESERAAEEAKRTAEREAEQRAAVILEPFKRAAGDLQDVFADMFRGVFGGAEEDAKGFGERLVEIMRETAAQVAALLIFRPVIEGISSLVGGGSGGGLGSLFGGLLSRFGLGSAGAAGTSAGAGGFGGSGGAISSLLGAGRSLLGGLNTSILGSGTFLGGLLDTAVLRGIIPGSLGNAILGATTPLSGLGGLAGGFIASRLGLGSGTWTQTALGGVGGLAGGIAGAAGGAAIGGTLGMALGPVGALVGAFLGTALSGLFGGKKKPNWQDMTFQTLPEGSPEWRFEAGQYADSPFGRIGIRSSVGTRVTTGYAREFTDAIASVDRAVAKNLSDSEVERVRLALQAQPNSSEVKTLGKKFGEEALDRIVYERLGREFGSLGLLSQYQGITNQVLQANGGNWGGIRNTVVEQSVQFLAERKAFLEQLSELEGGPTTQATQALRDLNRQFEELAEKAEVYGVKQDRIDAIREQATARLEAERVKSLAAVMQSVAELANPLSEEEKARRALQKTIDDAIEQAKQLNANEQQLAQIRADGATAAIRLEEQLAEAARSAWSGAIASVEEFRRRITATTASPLAPRTVFENARDQFVRTSLEAFGGDANAVAAFPTIADSLIEAAQAFYGSGPQFVAVFEAIESAAARLEKLDLGGNDYFDPKPNSAPLMLDAGDTLEAAQPRAARRAADASASLEGVAREFVVATATQTEELRAELQEIRAEVRLLRDAQAASETRSLLAGVAPDRSR